MTVREATYLGVLPNSLQQSSVNARSKVYQVAVEKCTTHDQALISQGIETYCVIADYEKYGLLEQDPLQVATLPEVRRSSMKASLNYPIDFQ
jgi:hypothetical protein